MTSELCSLLLVKSVLLSQLLYVLRSQQSDSDRSKQQLCRVKVLEGVVECLSMAANGNSVHVVYNVVHMTTTGTSCTVCICHPHDNIKEVGCIDSLGILHAVQTRCKEDQRHAHCRSCPLL